jgi:hypothetical protein
MTAFDKFIAPHCCFCQLGMRGTGGITAGNNIGPDSLGKTEYIAGVVGTA